MTLHSFWLVLDTFSMYLKDCLGAKKKIHMEFVWQSVSHRLAARATGAYCQLVLYSQNMFIVLYIVC